MALLCLYCRCSSSASLVLSDMMMLFLNYSNGNLLFYGTGTVVGTLGHVELNGNDILLIFAMLLAIDVANQDMLVAAWTVAGLNLKTAIGLSGISCTFEILLQIARIGFLKIGLVDVAVEQYDLHTFDRLAVLINHFSLYLEVYSWDAIHERSLVAGLNLGFFNGFIHYRLVVIQDLWDAIETHYSVVSLLTVRTGFFLLNRILLATASSYAKSTQKGDENPVFEFEIFQFHILSV